ncbi:MAG: N-acyl homoserine lactonase family protein [Micrococcaceae bacterium]
MTSTTTSISIYAVICGYTTVPASFIVAGEEGTRRLPVPSFLIRHPQGDLVFDTGFNARLHTDPEQNYVPEGFFETREFEFGPADESARQFRNAGFDPDAVRYVATSHLHYDHTGGNHQFPGATVILQEAEYLAGARAPEDFPGYRHADFLTGQNKLLINGEHDVFGDGSVRLVPTYGHTPGHQSLVVELTTGPVMLTADACYLERTLEEGVLPGVISDPERFTASLATISAFRDAGGRVVVGHDPDYWGAADLAPRPLIG